MNRIIVLFFLFASVYGNAYNQKFTYYNIYNHKRPNSIYKTYYNRLSYSINSKYKDSIYFDGENISVIKGKLLDSSLVIYVRQTNDDTPKLNIHLGVKIKKTIQLPIDDSIPFPKVVLSERSYESGAPVGLRVDSIECLPKFYDEYNRTVKLNVLSHIWKFKNIKKNIFFRFRMWEVYFREV